jgi:peptidylprolyl isomerase
MKRQPWLRDPGIAGAMLAGSAMLLLAAACNAKAEDPVVVKSDTTVLHVSEVKSLVDGLEPAAKQQIKDNPQVLAGLLKQEIEKRALQRQVQAQHWDQRPEVREQIEKARQEVVLNSFLRSVSDVPASYPSQAEIEQAYKLNQQRFLAPRQFHLAQIYVAEPAGGSDSAPQTKAAGIARQLHATPDRFAELARNSSDDKASSGQGGDLGWLAESQIAPEIRSVVLGMSKGEVSEPIRVNGGWHVVRLLNTKPAGIRSLDEVKPELVQLLRRQKAQDNAVAYMNKLLADQHAAIDEISLEKVTAALR